MGHFGLLSNTNRTITGTSACRFYAAVPSSEKTNGAFITTHSTSMKVCTIPMLSDNYGYVILYGESPHHLAVAVDIPEPRKVIDFLQSYSPLSANVAGQNKSGDHGASDGDRKSIPLTHVLTTHHHDDHCAGNEQLLEVYPFADVISGDTRTKAVTRMVFPEDVLKIGRLNIRVIDTKCHTRNHIAFFVTDDNHPEAPPALFSGDCLFAGGCGRFFEGTAEDMFQSLQNLAKLPKETRVYFGHEYTVSNLSFAGTQSAYYGPFLSDAKDRRAAGLPTTPSTIGRELEQNIFMRSETPEALATARAAKDNA